MSCVALTGTFDTSIALTGTVCVYEAATGTPTQLDFSDANNSIMLAVA